MYRIGEFSKMSKTTIKTLRYYDEIGLLRPASTDPLTGYRFYTTTQLLALHHIQSLRQVGLSLDETQAILAGASAEHILQSRQAELVDVLASAQEQITRIAFILSGQEEEQFMNYQATIKETPGCIVYSKEMTVPNHDAYFELLPALGAAVQQANPAMKCVVPEYCFIEYLDGEYKERDIHVEYCEAVDRMGVEVEGIVFKQLEPTTVVSVMHKGPYTALPQAYAFAIKWVEENGYILADIPRESYIDGIWNQASEENWLTELQVPIAKKK